MCVSCSVDILARTGVYLCTEALLWLGVEGVEGGVCCSRCATISWERLTLPPGMIPDELHSLRWQRWQQDTMASSATERTVGRVEMSLRTTGVTGQVVVCLGVRLGITPLRPFTPPPSQPLGWLQPRAAQFRGYRQAHGECYICAVPLCGSPVEHCTNGAQGGVCGMQHGSYHVGFHNSQLLADSMQADPHATLVREGVLCDACVPAWAGFGM